MGNLVILDRDRVINRYQGKDIDTAEAFEPISGSLEAIARLNHAGYIVAVTTHQPGVGEGRMNLDALNAVHARFQHLLARVGGHVDGIFICPHAPDAGCDCRKPEPGLLLSIAKRFGVQIAGVPVIGSHENDLLAARSVEATPYLIASQRVVSVKQVLTFNDLQHAVEHLLSEAT